MTPIKRIGALTSGGDAPGMNTALRALVKVAVSHGIEVVGIERGYLGLLAGEIRPLTRKLATTSSGLSPMDDVEVAGGLGGSILGSARCPAFYEKEARARAASRAATLGLDGLVVIGGNGSLAGAHALAVEHGVRVIGVPASIDNDIGCTSTAIGVDTALNTIVEACDRISDTARAHRRAFVVEVMGRQSGYLCMASAIAAGADVALFREQNRDEAEFVSEVAETIRKSFAADRGKQRVLIVKAEGVEMPCTKLVRLLSSALGNDLPNVSVRATVLGHLVRGGAPSYQDRMVASRFSLAAVNALLEGRSDEMVAWNAPIPGGTKTVDPSVSLFTLEKVQEETRALLDGSSPITQKRVELMKTIAGVLAL